MLFYAKTDVMLLFFCCFPAVFPAQNAGFYRYMQQHSMFKATQTALYQQNRKGASHGWLAVRSVFMLCLCCFHAVFMLKDGRLFNTCHRLFTHRSSDGADSEGSHNNKLALGTISLQLASTMMDFVLQMMNCVFKLMNFALQMGFQGSISLPGRRKPSECARRRSNWRKQW